MRIVSPLTLLLLLSVQLSADPDWAKVHEKTLEGIDHLFQLELALAEETFDQVIRMAPADPRGYFFKSMIPYWTYNLTQDRKAYDRFFQMSDRIIDLCRGILEREPGNTMAKFYLGGIYGYRGLAYQRNGSLWNAVWDGRRGYRYLEEAATKGEGVEDAQFGFGLFQYLVARVPKSFRWILSILGFSGDREGGLAAIKRAADHGTYTRNEAAFFYAQICYLEQKEEDAYAYLHRLLEQYPENTLFLVTYAQWEFRNNNLENALEAAERAVEINERRNLAVGDQFAFNVLGGIHFARNDYRQAVVFTERSIERTEHTEGIVNATYYRLGLSYELLGRREEAVETYRKARKADRDDNPWQYHYYRLARKRLVLPLDSLDILHIRGVNASSLRNYDTAIALFTRIARHPAATADQRVLALYGLSGAHLEQESPEEALQAIDELITIRPSQEVWMIPHAYFRRGIICVKLGRREEARWSFRKVADFDDYEYQARLETRAEEELRNLETTPGR